MMVGGGDDCITAVQPKRFPCPKPPSGTEKEGVLAEKLLNLGFSKESEYVSILCLQLRKQSVCWTTETFSIGIFCKWDKS